MLPTPDARRAAACLGPGHADRGTMAILARHAELIAAGDAWGSVTMVEMNLPTPRPMRPQSCATCRFQVTVVVNDMGHLTHECRAEPPRPRAPFPWTGLDRWCGFWEPVPEPEAGEPAHYAGLRDTAAAAG